MNRDKFTNIDPTKAGMATMFILTALQQLPQEEQVVALAAVFRFLLEARGIPVQDAMEVSSRVMMSNDGVFHPEFKAAQMYVKYEM